MASKKSTIVVYVSEVGPVKTASNGDSTYYEVYVQDSPNTQFRIGAFDIARRTEFLRYAASKEPVALGISKSGTSSTFNGSSTLRPCTINDISFEWKEFASRLNRPPQKVIVMSQAPAHKAEYVSINVHVSFDERPLEPIVTKKGPTKVKRDVVFEDRSGHVINDVFKPVFDQLRNNQSYKLTNMHVGEFRSKVQFTSTVNTRVSSIPPVVVEPVGPGILQELGPVYEIMEITRFLSVKHFRIVFRCFCGEDVVADNMTDNLYCQSCTSTTPVAFLTKELKGEVLVNIGEEERQWLVLSDQSLANLVNVSGPSYQTSSAFLELRDLQGEWSAEEKKLRNITVKALSDNDLAKYCSSKEDEGKGQQVQNKEGNEGEGDEGEEGKGQQVQNKEGNEGEGAEGEWWVL